jgi:hypothetical protein
MRRINGNLLCVKRLNRGCLNERGKQALHTLYSIDVGFSQPAFALETTKVGTMRRQWQRVLRILRVTEFSGRKVFLPVEPQSGLSFLFLLGRTQVRLRPLLY